MNPKNEMIKIRIKGIASEIKGIAVCSKLKKPAATGEVRRRRPEGVAAPGRYRPTKGYCRATLSVPGQRVFMPGQQGARHNETSPINLGGNGDCLGM